MLNERVSLNLVFFFFSEGGGGGGGGGGGCYFEKDKFFNQNFGS